MKEIADAKTKEKIAAAKNTRVQLLNALAFFVLPAALISP
jgi:hypothetical protein